MRRKAEIKTNRDKEILIEAMKAVIAGDYTQADLSQFEDKELCTVFNELITSMQNANNYIVMRLNNSMSRIGDSSCVKDMIEQVNSQNVSIADMRGASKDLGDSIMSIQDSIIAIQNNTSDVMRASDDSIKDMERSVEIVDASTQSVLDINTQIAEFKEKAIKINEIIDMVKKIASKSGLLALNASIEAARAGDAGRSFAVVAGQIKDLSANTTQSAETVVQYVDELMQGIEVLSQSITSTTNKLQSGNESVHKSIASLDTMNEQLDAIKASVDTIYDEINNQTALTENFVASIDSIAESYDELSRECLATGSHLFKISRDVDKTRSDLARKGAKPTQLDWLKVYEIDHLIFTWRIYNHIAGFEELKLEQVNNPKTCKFGKWANSLQDTRITNTREFRALVASHEDIHRYVTDCFNHHANANHEQAMLSFGRAYDAYQSFLSNMKDVKRLMINLGMKEETVI